MLPVLAQITTLEPRSLPLETAIVIPAVSLNEQVGFNPSYLSHNSNSPPMALTKLSTRTKGVLPSLSETTGVSSETGKSGSRTRESRRASDYLEEGRMEFIRQNSSTSKHHGRPFDHGQFCNFRQHAFSLLTIGRVVAHQNQWHTLPLVSFRLDHR